MAARRPGKKKRDELKANGCSCCGSKTDITLHHLIPREMGGATEEDNLLAVCRPCHDAIHSGDLDVTDLVLQINLKRAKNLVSSISNVETKSGA
ncbi:HNH endonuclease signature motif containing protein [Ectopseudomonas chengduensis]